MHVDRYLDRMTTQSFYTHITYTYFCTRTLYTLLFHRCMNVRICMNENDEVKKTQSTVNIIWLCMHTYMYEC